MLNASFLLENVSHIYILIDVLVNQILGNNLLRGSSSIGQVEWSYLTLFFVRSMQVIKEVFYNSEHQWELELVSH